MADQTSSMLAQDDLSLAPIDQDHKDLINVHFRRLHKIIHEHDEAAIGQYTNKQAAREQLARMTLVLRDYLATHGSSGQRAEESVESMVADIIDASYFLSGTQQMYTQPIFISSTLFGREQEVAALMQEQSAESVDDVLELWNLVPERTNKVLPDHCPRHDIGCDIDWNDVLCRSRSESNLLHYRKDFEVEDYAEWEERLRDRKLEELDLQWPPVLKEQGRNTGRQRQRTNTASIPASRAESMARERATSVRRSRRSTLTSLAKSESDPIQGCLKRSG